MTLTYLFYIQFVSRLLYSFSFLFIYTILIFHSLSFFSVFVVSRCFPSAILSSLLFALPPVLISFYFFSNAYLYFTLPFPSLHSLLYLSIFYTRTVVTLLLVPSSVQISLARFSSFFPFFPFFLPKERKSIEKSFLTQCQTCLPIDLLAIFVFRPKSEQPLDLS